MDTWTQWIEALSDFLCAHTAVARDQRLLIAYSGGLDSTVLLHLMSVFSDRCRVEAIHVHHGLHTHADLWLRHCTEQCSDLHIPLIQERIVLPAHTSGQEGVARSMRYQCIARHMQSSDCVVLAHHLNDQAETFFLNLLRGSGTLGLAAMPACRSFAQGRMLRPFLSYTRSELCDLARARGWKWIEDPSNDIPHCARNFLRHTIIPQLEMRWPEAVRLIARSSNNCAIAHRTWIQHNQFDWEIACGTQNVIPIQRIHAWSLERKKNFLRAWIHHHGQIYPSHQQLNQVVQQMNARQDAQPVLIWPTGAQIRRFKNCLYWLSVAPKDARTIPPLFWNIHERFTLPCGLGDLVAHQTETVCSRMVHVDETKPCVITFYQGGERMRMADGHTHRLKKKFQEWGIPPWKRKTIPLIYQDAQLICVVGYASATPVFSAHHGMYWIQWLFTDP